VIPPPQIFMRASQIFFKVPFSPRCLKLVICCYFFVVPCRFLPLIFLLRAVTFSWFFFILFFRVRGSFPLSGGVKEFFCFPCNRLYSFQPSIFFFMPVWSWFFFFNSSSHPRVPCFPPSCDFSFMGTVIAAQLPELVLNPPPSFLLLGIIPPDSVFPFSQLRPGGSNPYAVAYFLLVVFCRL